MKKRLIKELEVNLKTVERCNINCTYCHFFNGIDDGYKVHPPYMTEQTIQQVAKFLKIGCVEHQIESVQIDLNGGEPTMQKQYQFVRMCDILEEKLKPVTQLKFSMQTNGMYISQSWLHLFEKYNVRVGVSMDGPKQYHDKYRIDKNGESTYEYVKKGFNLLKRAADKNKIPQPALLCVINPEHSAKVIYRHFVDDLKAKKITFFLPYLTHDLIAKNRNFDAKQYGKFLCAVFDEWINDDDQSICVRLLNSTLKHILEKPKVEITSNNVLRLTIASNGDLSSNDALRSAHPMFMNMGLNVSSATFKAFTQHHIMKFLHRSEHSLPRGCQECRWRDQCRGGLLINRYSQLNLFNTPSVMCDGLLIFYQHLVHKTHEVKKTG